MAGTSEMQIPTDRFAEYIDELREFSGTHRVPFGNSGDLAQLLESLRNSEAFGADFCSLIRSVVFREHCKVSESQLLTLVMVAWGGVEADRSVHQLPSLVKELQRTIRSVLASSSGPPSTVPTDGSEALPTASLEFDDTIREIEETNPDVQLYRQLLKIQDKKEERVGQDSVSVQREASVQNREPSSSASRDTREIVLFSTIMPSKAETIPQFQPSAAEVLALGLIGLAVALLLNLGTLPVYRAHVSVYLPSAIAGANNPLASSGGTASSAFRSSSEGSPLRNGELTERTAERLLALPHPNPIFKQDALSRGMRDLHLGGNETILYADLVADTAHQVRVRQLPSPNLYEISCDSWSARFATTFCNELMDVLDEQLGGALSSQQGIEPGAIVDKAVGPGIQIYPRWYLVGLAGLAVGCLAGIAVGFVKRPIPDANQEQEDRAV